MKVVFLQNIKGVAQIGDIKDVHNGYARNFLLPRKMAVPASPAATKTAEALVKKKGITAEKQMEFAQKLTESLKNITLEITGEANSEGHLYGSVDAKHIAQELKIQYHIDIDSEIINLPHNLKALGVHDVELNPASGIKILLKVSIIPR